MGYISSGLILAITNPVQVPGGLYGGRGPVVIHTSTSERA
ncbi:hypothetical protein ASZ90_016252 [hydrocarbon metagenome]|uniref:Uncharacterized protein n=1 Tax=hydrocarbon metagenome TaxID=938273 RepID=A0A0W8F001_9ZZZZ